ncbi:MAG: ABC transporter permease [Flavobacteriaceae bacterium]
MNVSFYIAKRYLFAKSHNTAINYITRIASIGIIVGTAALFIVLSGFGGLKAFSLEFTTLTDPDLKIFPKSSKTIRWSSSQKQALNGVDGIISFSEIVEDNVLMACDDKFLAVHLKGVDEYYPQKTIDSILSYGSWVTSDMPHVVSGWGVSNTLGFGVYDVTKTVRLYAPKPGKGQILSVKGAFKSLKVINVGVFQVNDALNESMVFTSIDNAKYMLGIANDQVSAIELTLDQAVDPSEVISDINTIFQNDIVIKNRVQLNDALYKMLNTEHVAVYLIFTLILIIALFNIIGSIVMMIVDKKENLKTLYKLGAQRKTIQKVFYFQGLMMTLIGGALGIILGLVVIVLQKKFDLIMITNTLPYPVEISWNNIGVAFLTITILGIIASKIASWSSKKLNYSH